MIIFATPNNCKSKKSLSTYFYFIRKRIKNEETE